MPVTHETEHVTETTVVWSVKLVGGLGRPNQFAMGVGWLAMIAAVKKFHAELDEDFGDSMVANWTGSGGQPYHWLWHPDHDAPASLPMPEGLDNAPAA